MLWAHPSFASLIFILLRSVIPMWVTVLRIPVIQFRLNRFPDNPPNISAGVVEFQPRIFVCSPIDRLYRAANPHCRSPPSPFIFATAKHDERGK